MADIPDSDSEFNAIQPTWVAYITSNLVRFGFSVPEGATLTAAQATWTGTYDANILIQQQAKMGTQAKDVARYAKPGGFETLLRSYRQRIAAHTECNDVDRAALGLPLAGGGGGSPPPSTPSRPVVSLETSQRLTHKVRWVDEEQQKKIRPAGVKETEIFGAITAQGAPAPSIADYTFLARDTASPYTREFEPADGGKTAYYLLRYIYNDGSHGTWSEVASATVVA